MSFHCRILTSFSQYVLFIKFSSNKRIVFFYECRVKSKIDIMAPTEISPSDFFFHFDNISFALCERRSFTMAEERILLLSQPAASICDAGQKWFRIDLLKKKKKSI